MSDASSAKSVKRGTMIVVLVIAAVVFFGAGFGVSHYYFGAKTSGAGYQPGMGQGGFGGRMRGGPGGASASGFVSGQVIKKDTGTLSVQSRDNSMKLILVSSSTVVTKMAQGSLNDVAQGTEVMVSGTANADGSVTAQTVQIRPAMPTPPEGTPPTPAPTK